LEATSPAGLFFRLIRDIWQIGQSVAKNPGAPAQFLSSCYCVVEIEFDKAHNLLVIFFTAAGTAVASPHGLCYIVNTVRLLDCCWNFGELALVTNPSTFVFFKGNTSESKRVAGHVPGERCSGGRFAVHGFSRIVATYNHPGGGLEGRFV
jgi:hypothetical protein